MTEEMEYLISPEETASCRMHTFYCHSVDQQWRDNMRNLKTNLQLKRGRCLGAKKKDESKGFFNFVIILVSSLEHNDDTAK